MLDAAMVDGLAWIVGLIIIYLFSWNFFNAGDYSFDSTSASLKSNDRLVFNEPLLPIYSTSRIRYRKWFFVFFSIITALYVLVALGLDKSVGSNETTEWYKSYNQIFAALLISGLVNVLPKQLQFLDILMWIRNATHRRAKIPERALSIFNNIMNFDLKISEQDIKSSILFIGKDYIGEADFAEAKNHTEQDSIEKNWAKTCHLMTSINTLTGIANSAYANNISRPELVFGQAEHNFNIIKDDIKRYRVSQNNISVESLKERTRLLLKQFSKLIVCLVFASEKKEEDIFKKLQGLGINLRKRIKYELNISVIAISMLGFACLSFVSVFLTATFVPSSETSLTSEQIKLISLSAVLIICAPIMATFCVKIFSPDSWPVRGQFSPRKATPAIVLCFLGIGFGLFGFYVMGQTSLFGEKSWYDFWPYTLMAGFISAYAAIIIDSKSRIWSSLSATIRAMKCGVIASLGFLIIAVVSVMIVNEVNPNWDESKQVLGEKSFALWISSIIGFMSGVIISLLAEFSTSIKNEKEELHINLSEYLLPVLGYGGVTHMNDDDLNHRLHDVKDELPSAFYAYMKEKGFISANEDMSAESVNELKSDLNKVYETEAS